MNRTGNLFHTLRIVSVSSVNAVLSAGSSRVPYAKVHNEGDLIHHKARTTTVTHTQYTSGKFKGKTLFSRNNESATYSQKASVGAYTVKMPQRQFMGKSPALLKDIKTRFKTNFKTL